MYRLQCGFILALSLLASQGRAQSQLPTLDQALKMSQETGRPIFAMAGQKT
jgi:hypothetical protein